MRRPHPPASEVRRDGAKRASQLIPKYACFWGAALQVQITPYMLYAHTFSGTSPIRPLSGPSGQGSEGAALVPRPRDVRERAPEGGMGRGGGMSPLLSLLGIGVRTASITPFDAPRGPADPQICESTDGSSHAPRVTENTQPVSFPVPPPARNCSRPVTPPTIRYRIRPMTSL